MAKGKKNDYDKLVLVMSDYFTTRSSYQTGRNLDMPPSTVKSLVDAHINDPEFIELRIEKEKEFIEKANHLIFKSMNRMDAELDKDEAIPISQLSTAIGTLYDKKTMMQTGGVINETPNVQINIVDGSNLEKSLYEGDE